MASKTIKGLTVQIGADTSSLGEALDKVGKKSKNISGELREVNKLLKFDPKNPELLAQKQKILANEIENTEEKLEVLKEAEKQVQEQFKKGDVSEAQVRALKREIMETEKKLNGYKTAAKETRDEVLRLGNESDDAAKDVDDLGDSADKAEKEADDLGGTLDGSLSNGLKAAAALAATAAAAIIGTAEATQEYRNAMGRLDTAYQAAEHSTEAAKKTYKELQSILGDTDTAVEASTLLAQFCDTEEDLAEMTNTLAGVYARFPDSLPVEALVESANETMRTGQIAGNLADALNWAAAAGETFGVKLKANTKVNEEWNKKVKEAASAEDYFNLALEECSNEQERQKLIMSTLNRLYGKAGTEYKKTNKAVIEANKANEEWNETLAEIGEEVQPVVTDIKKLGVAFAKDAKEPIKDTARFVSKELLPALVDAGKWVKKNGPLIKSTLVGITTALVAYKTATIATTVAEKGLKGAIMATTVAQKALNLVQAASPTGLLVTAIVGAGGLLIALDQYTKKANEAAKNTSTLSAEELEMAEASREASAAFRDQQKATQESMGGIAAEMRYVQDLANELRTLADESGKVQEKDQARAQYILGELNEALGTEYSMTGNVIKNYKDLKKSIDEVIQSKTVNALLEAGNADYVEALHQEDSALTTMRKSYDDYQAKLKESQEAINLLSAEKQKAWENEQWMRETGNYAEADAWRVEQERIELEIQAWRDAVAEKKSAYDTDAANYGNVLQTIDNYRAAEQAALQGDYELAQSLLLKKSDAYFTYSKDVDAATRDSIDTLYKEAEELGKAAEEAKANYNKGMDGYTAESVAEAYDAYDEAIEAWANAYNDAHGVGTNLGGGLVAGMEYTIPALKNKARQMIRDSINAMFSEAEINSPSKRTMPVGEGLGEGTEVGIEKTTPDVAKAGRRQVDAVVNAYTDQEAAGQAALRGVAEQQAARIQSQTTLVASANAGMLEKILTAIEKGQVLTIDGDTLVGATAQRMDNALGQRRGLAARGVIK